MENLEEKLEREQFKKRVKIGMFFVLIGLFLVLCAFVLQYYG
jgi:predicted nucleic acid-binding Zn ribbon protein